MKHQHLFEKAKFGQIGKMNVVILNVKVAKLEAFLDLHFQIGNVETIWEAEALIKISPLRCCF